MVACVLLFIPNRKQAICYTSHRVVNQPIVWNQILVQTPSQWQAFLVWYMQYFFQGWQWGQSPMCCDVQRGSIWSVPRPEYSLPAVVAGAGEESRGRGQGGSVDACDMLPWHSQPPTHPAAAPALPLTPTRSLLPCIERGRGKSCIIHKDIRLLIHPLPGLYINFTTTSLSGM